MNYGPAQGPAQPPYNYKKPRTGAAFWIAIVMSVLLMISIIFNVVSFQPFFLSFSQQGEGLVEYTDPQYGDPRARNRIAVISVNGVIVDEDYQTMFGGSMMGPVSFLKAQLAQAASDHNVRAVIVEINSPGGSVTASDAMYHEIVTFKQQMNIPVIVYVGEMAASGGYYIAAPADCIVASPTAITGSIGVIMSMVDVSGALNALRIEVKPIISKGCDFKDTGSPTKKLSEAEEAYLREIVDRYYDQFVGIVHKGRSEKSKKQLATILDVEKIANGKIYNTQQALANGLVDKEGYFETAYEEALNRVGIESAELVRYGQQSGGNLPFFMSGGNMPTRANGDINLLKIDAGSLATLPRSRFLYMWQPGITQTD